MQSNLVVYDVGSTYTKVSAFSMTDSSLSLLARDQVPTTVTDIQHGIADADRAIVGVGVSLAADRRILATSSAAGGLRMVAMGYMPRVTAKAAKEVSMNAGARVLEIVTHEDPPDYRVEILKEIRPDIILLAGGTDGGDRSNLIENAEHIVSSGVKAMVIIAGNVSAQSEVYEILKEAGVPAKRVANVMPTIHELKVGRARDAIHEEFIKQISLAKGLNKLVEIVSDNVVVPTPGAILMAAELLARGTFVEEGVGDVIIIDIGGATTDIHSILPSLEKLSNEERGLVVTNEKQTAYRTVEGYLGLRISATGIIETVGAAGILAKIGKGGEELCRQLDDYTVFLEERPDHIATSEQELLFDRALAISAIEIALKRHAGYIAQEYNPVMGIAPGTPIGRDLRGVRTVIAVGGIFTHSPPAVREFIVAEAMKNRGISLLPEAFSVFYDGSYLLYVIGILSRTHQDIVLRFAKQYLGIYEKREKVKG
jgi:uncharacterized protein (TIGR01319 family)